MKGFFLCRILIVQQILGVVHREFHRGIDHFDLAAGREQDVSRSVHRDNIRNTFGSKIISCRRSSSVVGPLSVVGGELGDEGMKVAR